MYKSFEIKNFRCFQELRLKKLERVNLIAGMNNVGKTTLLEALFIHAGPFNPELVLRVNIFRGIQKLLIELGRWVEESPWDSIFRDFKIDAEVELKGELENIGERIVSLKVVQKPDELSSISQYLHHSPEEISKMDLTSHRRNLVDFIQEDQSWYKNIPISSEVAKILKLEYWEGKQHGTHYLVIDANGFRTIPIPPPSSFQVIFLPSKQRVSLSEDAERYGKLEIRGKQEVLLRALQVIEPRLERVSMIVTGGNPIIHGIVSGLDRPIPLIFLGDGMVRLASLVLAIGNASNGIVLVDEIENGLHYSILSKVWRAIGEVAREFNTQVFATTHSYECIIAANEAFKEERIYDFSLHRLERKGDKIRAVTYDQEALTASIETGLEVR